jgi:hypothetical protein
VLEVRQSPRHALSLDRAAVVSDFVNMDWSHRMYAPPSKAEIHIAAIIYR